jgi:hypothetical protein
VSEAGLKWARPKEARPKGPRPVTWGRAPFAPVGQAFLRAVL